MNIGDKVVYPMHGAGEITSIEEKEVAGVVKSYYVFSLPMGNTKLMLPVDTANNSNLRELITPTQLEQVIEILRAPSENVAGSWNKRFHANLERLKSGDIFEAAAVARDLTRQNNRRKVSSGERRILELSRQILISEVVYVRGGTPEEVTAWIDELILETGD